MMRIMMMIMTSINPRKEETDYPHAFTHDFAISSYNAELLGCASLFACICTCECLIHVVIIDVRARNIHNICG